ncbi:MAG: hypothetical protein ACE5EI_00420 [Thermodesulfobacteriota bacterium]
MLKTLKENPLARHLAYTAAAVLSLAALYLALYSLPEGVIRLEAEDFTTGPDWVRLEDVNFSGSAGIMTMASGPGSVPATGAFTVAERGGYTIWLRYFGNYAASDLDLWNRAYTNNFSYIDYFGAARPQTLAVRVDGSPRVVTLQRGDHRYRWARVEAGPLDAGPHAITVWKEGPMGPPSGGGVTLDSVLITDDGGYSPGRLDMLPRQASEFFAPLLIVLFPLLVWYATRRGEGAGGEGGGGGARGRAAVYIFYSCILSLVLSVMWIDTDGGFWLWLTQNRAFTIGSIYTKGEALHHRYVYPPPIAAMLIGLRPVFTLFGATGGITPLSLILGKLIVIPVAAAVGVVLYRLEGERAVLLWALNSVVLFTVAANSMYFGLAFMVALTLLLIKRGRHYPAALALGVGLAYMSAAMLLVPPFLLLFRNFGAGKAAAMAALVLVPGFLIFLPYSVVDPAGMNARVMGAGISTWMHMHLGLRLGGVGLTALLYGALLAGLWVMRPGFDYGSVSIVFALTALIYLHIGAPHFLAWTVAFQPAVIVSAARLRREVFYSLYVTALMVWASFFMNTGGAGDRAGETGFFPYYIFYTWPFDVYVFIKKFYGRIDLFKPVDLEALTHSLSAGVSAVLFVVLALELSRRGGPAAEKTGGGAYD